MKGQASASLLSRMQRFGRAKILIQPVMGLGCRVQGLGFRVQGLGCNRVEGLVFRV